MKGTMGIGGKRSTHVTVAAVVAAAVALTTAPGGAAPVRRPTVATPTVTGPVTGGSGKPTLVSTGFDRGSVGYVGAEYFVRGTATAYTSSRPLSADGRWTVHAAGTAPYATRIVVYRPQDPKRFNGTVVVEWLNVTAGFDTAPDWGSAHTELIRSGSAWVGVSAQSVGVQGGSPTVGGVAAGGLKASDPGRYAPLQHPGDSFSYDIFSQAGRAVRGPTHPDPLGGLTARRLIAAGESQSAFRMVTYLDAVQPIARVFDGFLVHSRAAGGAALAQAPQPGVDVPSGTVIRRDLAVPVLTFQTETDLISRGLGSLPARQVDSPHFRLWEVAGTAHADAYVAGTAFNDTGDGAAEVTLLDVGAANGGPLHCSVPINGGPAHLVLNAAVHHLEDWVRTGTPPPRAPRLDVAPGPPATIHRDQHGNARGGIRTPLVDVPTATLQGERNRGGPFCSLFGTTVPFDRATLHTLYPTHAAYVAAFDQATDRAVAAGFLLPVDAGHLKAAAARSSIGTG